MQSCDIYVSSNDLNGVNKGTRNTILSSVADFKKFKNVILHSIGYMALYSFDWNTKMLIILMNKHILVKYPCAPREIFDPPLYLR